MKLTGFIRTIFYVLLAALALYATPSLAAVCYPPPRKAFMVLRIGKAIVGLISRHLAMQRHVRQAAKI